MTMNSFSGSKIFFNISETETARIFANLIQNFQLFCRHVGIEDRVSSSPASTGYEFYHFFELTWSIVNKNTPRIYSFFLFHKSENLAMLSIRYSSTNCWIISEVDHYHLFFYPNRTAETVFQRTRESIQPSSSRTSLLACLFILFLPN